MTAIPALVVLAKDPVAGRVKTRLCPPCTHEQAARLARAALLDTLAACAHVPAARHVLALDGACDRWIGRGFDVLDQRGEELGDRIESALADAGYPAVLVAMDTPQTTSSQIIAAQRALVAPGVDAILGPSADGGYWIIGLRRRYDGVCRDVPMSTTGTFECQLRRMHELGLRVRIVGAQHDVDEWSDALTVARIAPASRFGRSVRSVAAALERAP